MQIRAASLKMLNEFAPHIVRSSKLANVWTVFLLAIIAFGIVGLYAQIRYGHVVTGMRDYVVWGIYIVNFIFFIGISYAGAILAGTLHLLKVPWRRPIMRIAGLMSIVSVIVGPIFIILCIGRFDRLHYLFIHMRIQSPIVWDVFAIGTYLVGAVIFLYLFLIRDFAMFRDATHIKFPAWQRKIYKFLAMNWQGTDEQRKILASSRNLISILVIPMVIVISSILSWIFGMTLRPGWHSTIFGPYFVLAAIYSGIGMVIIIMWVFRKLHGLGEYLTDKHFSYMGYIMLAFAAAYGYITFSEYLTSWYGSEHWESQVLDKLFSVSEYGVAFVFANVAGILVPAVVVIVKKLRKPTYLAMASLVMIIAMWIKRYLIIVPTLESPLLPIEDIRPEFAQYSMTWVEWSLTLGGVATFMLLFTIAARFITVVPIAEMADTK